MESITIKVHGGMLKEIEKCIKPNYGTKSEFIRESIRDKIKQIERENAINRLALLKGSLKSDMSDKEAADIALRKIAKKLNVNLD